MNLSGFQHLNLQEYGQGIKERVQQWTGIPLSIGIAPTKVLAKIANRVAKKSAVGVYVTASDNPVLETIAVEDIWGIGLRWGKRLRSSGIDTAQALRDASDRSLAVLMGRGESTIHEWLGQYKKGGLDQLLEERSKTGRPKKLAIARHCSSAARIIATRRIQ